MKRIPKWVFRGGVLILALIFAGSFLTSPAGAQPDPSPSPEQPELTLTMRADNPVAGSGRIRLSIDIENQGATWPPFLWLRIIVPPNNMTIVQPQLDSGEVQIINADSTSSTYEIPAPANGGQQVRTFSVMLDLLPGPTSASNEVQADISLPDGPPLVTESLPDTEAAKLAQARPTETPAATETAAATAAATETALPPVEDGSPAPAVEGETASNELPAAQGEPAVTAIIGGPPPTNTVPAATPSPSPTPAGGSLSAIRGGWILIIAIGGVFFLGGLVLVVLLAQYLRRRNAPPKVALHPAPTKHPVAVAATVSAGTTQKVEPVVQKAYLQLLSAPGGTYPLEAERVTIGRADGNQIMLPENVAGRETLSRFHAAISWQNGNHIVEDLDSQNGIMVNGRATPKNVLQDGDKIKLGPVECQYHRGEPDEHQGENQP